MLKYLMSDPSVCKLYKHASLGGLFRNEQQVWRWGNPIRRVRASCRRPAGGPGGRGVSISCLSSHKLLQHRDDDTTEGLMGKVDHISVCIGLRLHKRSIGCRNVAIDRGKTASRRS